MASKTVDSYQCQHCLQIMKNGSHLKEHYYQKHFYCKECEAKFETRDEMIKHLTVQHGQKLRCDFCQYSSLRQREIQVGVKSVDFLKTRVSWEQIFAQKSVAEIDIFDFNLMGCQKLSNVQAIGQSKNYFSYLYIQYFA